MLFSKLLKSNRYGFRHEVEREIKRREEERGNMTRSELLDFLFGSYNSYPQTRLDLYIRHKPRTTVKHRLNCLWAYPVTLILAPFRFVLYGGIGWTNKTVVGRFILRTCGEDS